jgi:multicomponent Na+:H+ antiporter subunit B
MKDIDPKHGMSLVVKTVTRWLKGLILLYGLYLVLYGHLTPGGGFPGGVILTSAFILITLAEGQEGATKHLSKTAAMEMDSIGALIFLLVALMGIVTTGVFFTNFLSWPENETAEAAFTLLSGGIIPLCNIGIALKVGASLFMVFVILSAVRVVIREDGSGKMIRQRKRK